MAEEVIFDNNLHTEPVARARTVGGVQNAGAPLDYGKVCIIDTGLGASYGGGQSSHDGSGVKRNKTDYINEVNSEREMRDLMKGGILWDLASYLFNPSLEGRGPNSVYIIHARQAIGGTDQIVLDALGTMDFTTVEHGLQANGSVGTVSELIKGYGWKLIAGSVDPAKYVIEFYIGTYRGVIGSTVQTYGGVTEAQAEAAPKLVVRSAEVANLTELEAWADGSAEFLAHFTISATSYTGITGVFAAADITAFGSLDNLFAGATETYNSTDLDDVLDDINDLDNTFFLCDDFNGDADGTNNVKIHSFITTDADFKKFLIAGGSDNVTNMAAQSIASAVTYNSRYAIIVHGGIKVPYELNPNLFISKPSIYKSAMVAGRLSGLQPQETITWKSLNIAVEEHVLTKNERVSLLQSGVLHTKVVDGLGTVVNQGVNAKADNTYLISTDGSSHEISIERISAQLNRTLQEGSASLFIGGNLSTVGEADLIEYTESVLKKNLAIPGESDGLIVDYGNIRATRTGSTWNVEYDYQANSPINKVFHTGTIIDPTL